MGDGDKNIQLLLNHSSHVGLGCVCVWGGGGGGGGQGSGLNSHVNMLDQYP